MLYCRDAQRAVLVSTYEMGRQPFGPGVGRGMAARRRLGRDCVDAAKEKLREAQLAPPISSAFTFRCTRRRVWRRRSSTARAARQSRGRLVAFGLYAPLNEAWLRSIGVDEVLGGEFEEELTASRARCAAVRRRAGARDRWRRPSRQVAARRCRGFIFSCPIDAGCRRCRRYATLQMPDGTRRIVGYTEASRGCRHLCRHCPVVPVYAGQFRVVQPEVVLADIAAQVAAGAQHITFGDPDFFNGPTHAMRDRRRAARGASGGHLRRHDQDRAPAEASRSAAAAARHRLRVRDERGRIGGRRGARDPRERAHARRFRRGGRAVPRRRRDAGADLRRVSSVARRSTATAICSTRSTRSISSTTSRRFSSRSGCSFPKARSCSSSTRCARISDGFDPATLAYRWAHPDPRVDALQRTLRARRRAR